MDIDRLERLWVYVSAGVLLLFIAAIFYAAFGLGIQVNANQEQIHPSEVEQSELFSNPGVHEMAPGHYRVVMVARAWQFTPKEIRIPNNAQIEFVMTSIDVIHGFRIPNTTVNVMLIPGQITRVRYRFRDPGTYRFVCHEYCGTGHHLMEGVLIVE